MATLLPTAAFYLRLGRFAPARALVEAGAPVALASDVNPGGGLSPSLPFAMAIGCFAMGLSLEEALAAVTINAAFSLDLQAEVGSIEPGKRADLVLLRSPRLLDLVRVGVPAIRAVVKDGRVVVDGGRLVAWRRGCACAAGVSPGGGVRVRALSFHAELPLPQQRRVLLVGLGDPGRAGDRGRCAGLAGPPGASSPRPAPLRPLPRTAARRSRRAAQRRRAAAASSCAGARPVCASTRSSARRRCRSACRQFPRVVTLTPLGVSVTLSHYCPTAAALVISCDGAPRSPLRIVAAPPAFPASWPSKASTRATRCRRCCGPAC